MQSVPITTKVVSSNPADDKVHLIQHYKVSQYLAAGRWFSPGTPVSSTNKTDRHNINEILLKVISYLYTYIYRYMYLPKFNANDSDHLKYGFGRVKLDDSK
jgi:hypothetical protein